jgi:hypothetical protein
VRRKAIGGRWCLSTGLGLGSGRGSGGGGEGLSHPGGLGHGASGSIFVGGQLDLGVLRSFGGRVEVAEVAVGTEDADVAGGRNLR